MSAPFEVELQSHSIEAGGEVTGHVRITAAAGLARAKALTVVCRTRLHGSGTEEFLELPPLTLLPPFSEGAALPFTFKLATDSPISWSGRYVKVSWEVHARADVAWAIDPKTTVHFEVVPRRPSAAGRLTG